MGLLWGLGVSGALQLELWDALSSALDRPQDPLTATQVRQVFEAYCLAALRHVGPVPWALSLPQLQAVGATFWQHVVVPAGPGREALRQALGAAGLLPPGCGLTTPMQGHLLLFDVVVPGGCAGPVQTFLCPFVILQLAFAHEKKK